MSSVQMTDPSYKPTSSVSSVGAKRDQLIFRGYTIEDLTAHSSFEATIYLLLHSELPTKAQLDEFHKQIVIKRTIPLEVKKVLEIITKDANPTDVARTIVSLMGMLDKEKEDRSNQYDCCLRVASMLGPALLYWYHFSHSGVRIEEQTGPEDTIPANFLKLLTLRSEVDPDVLRAFEVGLICSAENAGASTFVARVTTSTLADYHSSITAAISCLKGHLHGGATEASMRFLSGLQSIEQADREVHQKLAKKEPIMGFGHRVYKKGDPRNKILKFWSKKLSEKVFGNKKLHDIACRVEEKMKETKNLQPNLDFFTSVIYYQCGIPVSLYTPIFAMARIAGWSAHVFEQRSKNKLIGQSYVYKGKLNKQVSA
jgi:2-methylcitrate synthase